MQKNKKFQKLIQKTIHILSNPNQHAFIYQETKDSIHEFIQLNRLNLLTLTSQEGLSKRGDLPINRKLYIRILNRLYQHLHQQIAIASEQANEQEIHRLSNQYDLILYDAIQIYKSKKYNGKVIPNQIIYNERPYLVAITTFSIAKELTNALNNLYPFLVAWYDAFDGNNLKYHQGIPLTGELAMYRENKWIYSKSNEWPLVYRNVSIHLIEEDFHLDKKKYCQFVCIDMRWNYTASKHPDGLFKIILKTLKRIQ
jgi:hypothetical protein